MKRKKRKGSTDDKPSSPDLGLWFFDWFFSSLFLNVLLFFSFLIFWVFYYCYFFVLFCFLLFCFLFCSCSLCVSDDTTCFRSATRNYPEKLTCQPRLHLLCSADTCWRKATDVDCPRTSPVWGSQPPLSLQEVGFSPTSPQTPPQCTPGFFFPLSFSFLVLHKRDLLSYRIAESGLKRGCKLLEWNLFPWQLLSAQVNSARRGGCGEGDGCSGSAVFHESRARSHQKPARSNSKISVEPRQYWGASSQYFLNLLFLLATFSFSFAPFFIYTCVYACIFIHKYTYIHTYIYKMIGYFILYRFAFWPAGRGKE